MTDFKQVLSTIYSQIENLAKETLSDYEAAAIRDGHSFVEKTKVDLERWASLLTTGKLKPNEFEFLLGAKRDLATLEALKQAGLAEVRATKFRDDLLGTIMGGVLKFLP